MRSKKSPVLPLGEKCGLEPKLFYHNISLERRVPDDHPLRQVETRVDFNFIRSKVADLYGTRGHESVDPAVILELMFLLFYENIKFIPRRTSKRSRPTRPMALARITSIFIITISRLVSAISPKTAIAIRRLTTTNLFTIANEDYIDWADHCLTPYERKRLMARRKHKAEGSFADADQNSFSAVM